MGGEIRPPSRCLVFTGFCRTELLVVGSGLRGGGSRPVLGAAKRGRYLGWDWKINTNEATRRRAISAGDSSDEAPAPADEGR